jgi:hypothetical protein
MKLILNHFLFLVTLVAIAVAQAPTPASLRGTVTDPSGAAVPSALVQVRGAGGEQRATTNSSGQYAFPALRPGSYTVRVIAQGFSVTQRQNFAISGAMVFDTPLTIEAETQVVNVQSEADRVTTDPSSNASALVLGEKELATLSDDPDELEQQLQAMAGPAAGPNGGQIYIDGFTGNNLPPKSAIREVRINSNPFSPEYDRPGFGRIEIFTKPGSDKIRGQAFMQYNKEALNSRSPLLTQSQRPPYQQHFYGFNISGPVQKQKSSFGLDIERRSTDDNAFIYATALDSNLNLQNINEGIVTPQFRTTIRPRFDYAISPGHTLVVRYQNTRVENDKQGIGDFNLPSRAYDTRNSENTVQITETSLLSPRAINETRFQFLRTHLADIGDNSLAAISVQGAFNAGGPQIGNSGNINRRWELTNTSTLTHGTHSFKWGARVRQSFLNDTSVNNFGGAYTFFGGQGPELDANNQPLPGTTLDLSAFERYRRTLLFQSAGLAPSLIRLYGGGASQFSLNAGVPLASVSQFDIGLFANDDWRVRPNLTLSYGLRYETQSNISDFKDFAPRVGVAWGIDGRANRAAKTILRAGFGAFYDRLSDNLTLQSLRFNGTTQQSYLLLNPDFFPAIPSPASLASAQQPQRLQLLYSGLQAPRTYQSSIGVERQINRYARVSVNYIENRGVHLQRSRNINAPIGGAFPYGDREMRLLTESAGLSRVHQFIVSPRINYKKIFLFGFYGLSYGKDDNEGQPADPYNLHAEWGPSASADVRHRFLLGTNLPLPWSISVNPFLTANSGTPYNITTGRDLNGDGFTSERPALISTSGTNCSGGSLSYAPGIGCLSLNPTPGLPILGRNSGRGPASITLNMRLSRTWGFGSTGESGPAPGAGGPEGGPPPGMGGGDGPRGGGGGPRGGGSPRGGGGGMRGGGGGGRGGGGALTGKKYNVTLSLSAHNLLNHPNYAPPSGDLSSPFFGQYRSLTGFGPFGGNSTYDRKVDVQLRFMF